MIGTERSSHQGEMIFPVVPKRTKRATLSSSVNGCALHIFVTDYSQPPRGILNSIQVQFRVIGLTPNIQEADRKRSWKHVLILCVAPWVLNEHRHPNKA